MVETQGLLEVDRLVHEPASKVPPGRPLAAGDFQIRCRSNNIVEARRKLGDAVMDRYTRIGSAPRTAPPR